MNVQLKPFQLSGVDRLVKQLRLAAKEAKSGSFQVISLASPMGSGKTLMATAAIEILIQGDYDNAPDTEASFLWISDQPELNEQTRRKMLSMSTVLSESRLVVIDATFDSDVFKENTVYFLNIQKLGKDKQLITPGDARSFTIWETINNTIEARPGCFFVFIDEAHRGMTESPGARKDATTIIQKLIKGSPGEIQATPLIVGISATPERFNKLLEGTERAQRRVVISPDDVRDSGLLKDVITLYHPRVDQPSDFTMLRAAVQAWKEYCDEWEFYCKTQNESLVQPIMTVQVQDRSDGKISKTDLNEAIRIINDVTQMRPVSLAHSFQEGSTINLQDCELRYLSPPDIEADSDVRIVFFKTSLNTGWDCPRAEVMMSFRTAVDAVAIAQLVGRMVRSPLARRVDDNEHLNSVALYLPHYNEQELKKIVNRLTEPDPDTMPPVQIKMGDDVTTLLRTPGSEQLFAELETIPSYTVPRARKSSQVRRLMKLSRLLARDALEVDGPEDATELLLRALRDAYYEVKDTEGFKKIVEQRGKIEVMAVNWRFSADLDDESEVTHLDMAKEDIDDVFEYAGRKLGEGLHKAWWRTRVAEDESAKVSAKLELIALCLDSNVLEKIERTAQEAVNSWLNEHKVSINKLPEAGQQEYNEIRRLATDPEERTLAYPTSIEGSTRDESWEKHLYVDSRSLYRDKFNTWETKVLETELARDDVIGWLRNPDRKDWSLCIPYESGDGSYHPCYPDFVVLRSVNNHVVIDILDPHLTKMADAPYKAKGLAQYAAKHAHKFGRIDLIVVEGGRVKSLNLCDETTREKVLAITTTEQLTQLFTNL
jgi:type III restriction enzyme